MSLRIINRPDHYLLVGSGPHDDRVRIKTKTRTGAEIIKEILIKEPRTLARGDKIDDVLMKGL